MSDTAFDFNKHVQALTEVHRDVKSICEAVGIDVKAAEAFAAQQGLALPWHDSVTPQRCLKEARSILSTPPEAGQETDDILTDLVCSYHGETLGLIGTLAVVDNQFWDPAAKAAFLIYFPFVQYERFTLPCPKEFGAPHPEPDGLRGALCWLVHDVLALQVLGQTELPKECSQVLDILSRNLGVQLAQHSFDAAKGASADEFNLSDQIEGVLLTLAQRNPLVSDTVKETLSVFTLECKSTEAPYASVRLADDLQQLYPDPVSAPDLRGERIGLEAQSLKEATRAALTLTNHLEQTLTSRPEWETPLVSVANDILMKGTVQLQFTDCRIAASHKARDILVDIIQQTPRVQLVFSVDQFFPRGPNDPSYQDLASELNHFITTDLASAFVSKVNVPDLAAQKDQTVGFLRDICSVAGAKNVKVLTPQELAMFKPAEGVPTCLVTHARANLAHVAETVVISLKGREQDDSAAASLSANIQLGMPPSLLAGSIQCAIFNCVIPLLGKKDLPKDQHGLNGYRSEEVVLSLSGENVDGIGQFPLMEPSHARPTGRGLVIVYTGKDEQLDDELPMDTEDTSLDEDPSETGDLVHKV
jgi:hypothetical protein